MFENFIYFSILGKPLIMYVGILAFISLLSTALVGFLNFKGTTIVPFRWHLFLAAFTIIIVIIHGTMGILAYF
jgi:hypothetical protein